MSSYKFFVQASCVWHALSFFFSQSDLLHRLRVLILQIVKKIISQTAALSQMLAAYLLHREFHLFPKSRRRQSSCALPENNHLLQGI